ncbi:MAG: PTS sugar transporter subunit IIC [Herbinix sp.]|nr:PTS sugar transporter subunit IIC [Herbinix sp.]
MSLVQVILITVITGLAGIDCYLEVFQTYRPLILGTIIGIIMGDLKTGMLIGATFEMMWMGLMPIGGAAPPNMVIGTVIGVVFGIASNQGADVAIGFGMPFAVLMQGIVILIYTSFSYFNNIAAKYISKNNYKAFNTVPFQSLLIVFLCYSLVAFIPIFLGADKAEFIVKILPEWVTNGLSVAGGLMPAIGFAILLNTMFRKENVIFLIVGFVFVAYLTLPILALAAMGACIAIYDFYIHKDMKKEPINTIEEDYSDGI